MDILLSNQCAKFQPNWTRYTKAMLVIVSVQYRMKKMQKTERKWHETKVFSFGSVCRTFLVACHTILQKGVSVGLFFRPKEDR